MSSTNDQKPIKAEGEPQPQTSDNPSLEPSTVAAKVADELEVQTTDAPAAFESSSTASQDSDIVQISQDDTPVVVPGASLHGKVALITGASRGIGKGCALELARRGASIIVNYNSDPAVAASVVAEIEHIGAVGTTETFNTPTRARAIAIRANVRSIVEVEAMFAEGKRRMGRIDIVMSNSGKESWGETTKITEEEYDDVFELNCKAQFFVAREALKYCGQGGRLVMMSSIAAGLMGIPNHALYSMTKMAILGATKSLATDAGPLGMTVNAISPGGIKSEMFTQHAYHYLENATVDSTAAEIEAEMSRLNPLGRCGVPQDVANAVAYLCSPSAEWITGQNILCAGGSSA